MESLKLNEEEHRYYEDFFKLCDTEKTAKIPKLVVGELFATSGLSTEVLLQIADLCGASRLGYFGRSQFYISLKLIAVTQQNYPLTFDSFSFPLALPVFNIPAFNMKLAGFDNNLTTLPDLAQSTSTGAPTSALTGGVLPPPPPTKKHARNMSGSQRLVEPPVNLQLHAQQLQQIQQQQVVSGSHVVGGANVIQSPNSALPQEAVGWASFTSRGSEESARPQQPAVSPDTFSGTLSGSRQSFKYDTVSLSSADYATSEAESVEDIWSINDEQREYYVNQFMSMQPDLSSTISGVVGKEFFEKSKLPTRELSKIWKLSDVNRDGALTLQEFCTAMHLVVLRRNDIELPAVLPDTLMPYIPASTEPFASDLPPGELSQRSPEPTTVLNNSWSKDGQWTSSGAVTEPSVPASASPPLPSLQTQWSLSSGLPSPSQKPVHFDVAPANDPDIVHPVAMHMSPTQLLTDNLEKNRTASMSDPPTVELNNQVTTRHRSNTDSVSESLGVLPSTLQSRPRPTPKKAQSLPGPTTLINPPPQGAPVYLPQVPPRHRSLVTPEQDMGDMTNSQFATEEVFPTEEAHQENFADFSSEFGKPEAEMFEGQNIILETGGDQEPSLPMQPVLLPTVEVPKHVVHQYSIRDKKVIQASIRQQRERNTMLVRLSSELNQELQEVMEQRISLEIQLEHLKPC